MSKNNPIIAFASGKGGTGKTSLAVNFAGYLSDKKQVCLVDLDVEEPNAGLFFKPDKKYEKSRPSFIDIPEVNLSMCNFCGICANSCNFNAIAVLNDSLMILEDLCKGCGRCINACNRHALSSKKSRIGSINEYTCGRLLVIEGRLDTGNIHTKALIKDVKKHEKKSINIYDCPPGTTCPMVESILDADFVVLVTEPTPFGLHDLTLAVEVVKKLSKRFGIVINKSDGKDSIIKNYASENGHIIIEKIPFYRSIARKCGDAVLYYSDGNLGDKMDNIYNYITRALT